MLLALDTATPAITAAVHDGSRVLGEATAHGAMAHGELLASQIRAALEQAGVGAGELTDVAVGVGPGPYTGLRVGVVTALTLAQTLDLIPHGVCTLDILAADTDQADVIVATDARRKEVYWARYAGGVRVDGPAVDKPATVAELGLPVIGRGAEIYADVLMRAPGPLDPSAAALARLVVAERAAELPLEPLYLRRPDATVPVAATRT
ncbi:tRNA (adenosine(37)-N6)-threonylcarbamoyltransferase complex dimerization subunit type 1 TsaB [Aeromicrobium sp. PE09-221]|nr:tRNA (adenosine(37)-N6)-threonylcarbamoyltransferase complex dimerization subunit type 1 TsaB [Aeromicrobium sp. PE09-221]